MSCICLRGGVDSDALELEGAYDSDGDERGLAGSATSSSSESSNMSSLLAFTSAGIILLGEIGVAGAGFLGVSE